MKIKIYVLLLIAFCFFGCASSNAVYKQDYDFSKIKNVYVENGSYSTQTQAIRDSIIKQLMSKGFNLKSSSADADIIVNYSITEYQPSKKYLVHKDEPYPYHEPVPYGPRHSNTIVVHNDPVEISGSSVYDLGTAFGVDNATVIASNATVGVSITIKDVSTKDIIWTNSYTYEGLDLTSAVDGVIRYILKAFPPEQIKN